MDSPALVGILSLDSGIFDDLDRGQFSGLLIVFDTNQVSSDDGRGIRTYVSPIFKFSPRKALVRCVKNSVLKTQLRRGSGSCGLPTSNENQSSLNLDVLTALMAPMGMVRSDEMTS